MWSGDSYEDPEKEPAGSCVVNEGADQLPGQNADYHIYHDVMVIRRADGGDS
jgi:hypothetical protein